MRYSRRLRERAAMSTQGAAHGVRRQYCFHLLFLSIIIKKSNLKNDRLYASRKHLLVTTQLARKIFVHLFDKSTNLSPRSTGTTRLYKVRLS